ncbi:MAG: hypothetical protein LKG27_05995 [Clostridiaceae bacterium]|jgi:hypothetical protein|nr:hypothetical protein [Clostridiaceae bacterium]
MLDSIKAIQGQNIFRVNPVKLDEQNRFEQNGRNAIQNQETGQYSPNHPNMQNSSRANHLDLLA